MSRLLYQLSYTANLSRYYNNLGLYCQYAQSWIFFRKMKIGMSFRGKICRTFKMNIYPFAEFNEILTQLNEITFIGGRINQEHAMYAVLELINNSLRAHREKSITKPLRLTVTVSPEGLTIVIKDFGGGFNPERLPYDISKPVQDVDTNNESFQQYRERHGYKRFGIGLYVARKTFTKFTLKFFNEKGDFVDYKEHETQGTYIEMTNVWREYD